MTAAPTAPGTSIGGLSGDPRYGDLFCGISLAHNRGHQHILLAGLMEALDFGCDCAVSMDADLQDDPVVIERMLADYAEGSEVVYGARSSRDRDTAFKRGAARMFYRLMRSLGVELVPDSADCRLMGCRSLEALSGYEEQNLFLRGLVPSIGSRSSTVYYERGESAAGESKYPLRKTVSFAVEGITSFSTAPIRLVVVLGFLFMLLVVAMLVWSALSAFAGSTVPGWSSLMVSLWFVGGALMLSIGVVGSMWAGSQASSWVACREACGVMGAGKSIDWTSAPISVM